MSILRKAIGNRFEFRKTAGVFLVLCFIAALAHVFAHDISGHAGGHFQQTASETCLLGKVPAASMPAAVTVDCTKYATVFVTQRAEQQVFPQIVFGFYTRAPPTL